MRRAARKDALHAAIGNIWRECGWSMLDISGNGDGEPDWFGCKNFFPVLIEVKTPGYKRPAKDGDTQDRQRRFRETWKACPVLVIESVEEAWREAETLRPA